MSTTLSVSKFSWCAAALLTILLAGIHLSYAGNESQVLAKIGNQTITEADLQEWVNAVPDRFRQQVLTPEGKKKTLDYIVNIQVMAAEAEKQGMDKAPEIQKLLLLTKNDLLARIYLDKMTKDLPAPTEQESQAYYEKNRSQYAVPESVHLHHILLKTEKEAKDARDRVVKKGEKFADVAAQVSICPSKAKGGNLDWLPKGSLVKEIEDVAFTMKNGEIKGPVQSKFGYHVLLLEDKKPAQESSYDQVKDYIIEQLKFQKQQEQYEKLAESLRKKMDVQVMLAPAAPEGPGALPQPTPPAAAPAGPGQGPK
ncbi:MAG: peptidyl-prolyl cis-trans isomerase [Desulfomonilaceae bacterium]